MALAWPLEASVATGSPGLGPLILTHSLPQPTPLSGDRQGCWAQWLVPLAPSATLVSLGQVGTECWCEPAGIAPTLVALVTSLSFCLILAPCGGRDLSPVGPQDRRGSRGMFRPNSFAHRAPAEVSGLPGEWENWQRARRTQRHGARAPSAHRQGDRGRREARLARGARTSRGQLALDSQSVYFSYMRHQ